MKLFRILPLVVGSAAAGILASTSPAHALTWNLNNVTFINGATVTGSFDFNGTGNPTNINVTLTGPSSTVFGGSKNFTTWTGDIAGNSSYVQIGENVNNANSNWVNLFISGDYSVAGTYSLASNFNYAFNNAGSYQFVNGTTGTISSASVPFDIPGGATIPAFGSLLALVAMRKARKSLASNTRIAYPVATPVSV